MRAVLFLGMALLGQAKDDHAHVPLIAADSAQSPLGLRLSVELDNLDLEIRRQHETVVLKRANLKTSQRLNTRGVTTAADLEKDAAELRYEEAREAERISNRTLRAYEFDASTRTVPVDDVKHYQFLLDWLKAQESMYQAEADLRAVPLEQERRLRRRGLFDPWKTCQFQIDFDTARASLIQTRARLAVVALDVAARSGQKALDPEEKHRLDTAYYQACVQTKEVVAADAKVVLDMATKRLGEKLILESEALQAHLVYDDSRDDLALHRKRLEEIKTYGERHPDYIKSLHNLAVALRYQGDYAGAKPLFERALALRKSTVGESSPTYAQSLTALAELLEKQGDLAGARSLLEQALATIRAALGERHPAYADQLSALAEVLLQQSDLAGARTLSQQALDVTRAALGERHFTSAERLVALASVHQAQGEYARARSLSEQALDVTKAALGERHPVYAQRLIALAEVLRLQGDPVVAQSLIEETLALTKAMRRDSHPAHALYLAELARGLSQQGDQAAARPLSEQALALTRTALGERHPAYAERLHDLATVLQAQGDFAGARTLSEQALDITRAALGEHHFTFADRLGDLAWIARQQGDYPRARLLSEQALAITKTALGERHPAYAVKLSALAGVMRMQADYAGARALSEQALAVTKAALGERHPVYAERLITLADVLRVQGDYARARFLSEQALDVNRAALGERHPNYARSLLSLAQMYHYQGDYPRAERLLEQSLALTRSVLRQDHPDHAASLSNLGLLCQAMGDYGRAEPLLRQALEIRKKAVGENHPDHATSLSNLGSLYQVMGDHGRAAPLFQQALEIRTKTLGENHPDRAASLNNLSLLCRATGDYDRAELLLQQALATWKKSVGQDHPDYATGLNNLGVLYGEMGDHGRAAPLLRQALEIEKRALGERHPGYARSLNNLGDFYRARGDYGRAVPPLRQALEIRKSALGEDHPEYADSLSSLGLLYVALRDYSRAEPLLRQAVEIRKKALGELHPGYAMSLNNLGLLYWAMGDYGRAEPLCRQALEILRKAVGKSHLSYARPLSSLGLLYWATGDPARAESLLKEALENRTAFFHDMASALGERSQIELLASQRASLDFYLTVAQENQTRPEDLQRRVLDWKGAAGANPAGEGMARDQPELKPTLEELAGVRAQLAQLIFSTSVPAHRNAWRRQLETLRERKEVLETELARHGAASRGAPQSVRIEPEQVIAALPAGTALVDVVEYLHSSPPRAGQGKPGNERRLLAFVLQHNRPVQCVNLGASRPVNSAVAAWRRALQERRPEALQAAAAELGRRVWDPLRPHLDGAHAVLVAPDGALNRFPFAALPGSRPGSYLIEDLAIGYVASGRKLVEAQRALEDPPGRGLLAAGDIDFQADLGRAAPAAPGRLMMLAQAGDDRGGFRPLPATGPEARRARDLFHAAFADQPADLLTGAEPTEAELKRRLDGGRLRVIHLATHGFFEPPGRIAALRGAVRQDDPFSLVLNAPEAGDELVAFEMTPLLHSGIVLAGGGRDPAADRADPSASALAREDGILTADEVQALDLRGCELVVLSACETGLGKLEHGQGVLGLQRAFQAAHARAVVASLWKVDDAATAVLMEQFYANLWEKKMPKLEALRQAQLAVLNDPRLVERQRAELKRGLGAQAEPLPEGGRIAPPAAPGARSDPALWAAFVYSGDTR